MRFPRAEPGRPITARHIELIYEALARLDLHPAAPLYRPPGANGLALALPWEGWIQVTGRQGAAFAWTEQVPRPNGRWSAGPRSGTVDRDPAFEINGNTNLPPFPFIVRAWRPETGRSVLFQVGECPSS